MFLWRPGTVPKLWTVWPVLNFSRAPSAKVQVRSPSWFFNFFYQLHRQDENVLLYEWEISVAGLGSTDFQETQLWGVWPYRGPLLFPLGTSRTTSGGWVSIGLLAGKTQLWLKRYTFQVLEEEIPPDGRDTGSFSVWKLKKKKKKA